MFDDPPGGTDDDQFSCPQVVLVDDAGNGAEKHIEPSSLDSKILRFFAP